MKIVLPELREKTKIYNNSIINLKDIEREIEIVINEKNRSYITFNYNNYKYCITGNKHIYSDNADYILLSNGAPTTEKIVIKKWLKHPDINENDPSIIIDSWKDSFVYKSDNNSNISGEGLRKPQLGAIHNILGHFTNSKEAGIVVLPTGTGKTETMLAVLIANRCEKLLVIVPSDSLRGQLSEKFISLGILKKFGIVSQSALYPKVGILDTGIKKIEDLKDFFEKSNVIISTMNLISNIPNEYIEIIAGLCSHLFVDEAHHAKAKQWSRVIGYFDKGKVIQFTATPFRYDGERLSGKFIYNFSMKDAQEQGYFQKIDFIPVREYDREIADKEIALKAIEKLKDDRDIKKLDHFLMARCRTNLRADEVFKLYENYTEFNPVVIHSNVLNRQFILENIKKGKHKIIVCVDMLGEGFDLPELKIAALHDIRKSLPITLQFIGRFTRVSNSIKLGNASFIANLRQEGIEEGIDLLYNKESNWNTILPDLSQIATQDQIDFSEFLAGFNNIEESDIPFQNINPAFSTLVYKNSKNVFQKLNIITKEDFPEYKHRFISYNEEERTLVILLGKEFNVEWGSFSEFQNFDWHLMVIHYETKNNLLFIHSSVKKESFNFLVDKVFVEGYTKVSEIDVFKVFYNVKRLLLFNVGMRMTPGKDKSFQSYFGSNLQSAITKAELNAGFKNNIFGVGFENGDKVSFGASTKGKIWSYLRGNLKELTNWCSSVGDKLIDPDIDPNEVLDTLEPKVIETRPVSIPYFIDWNPLFYKEIDKKYVLKISGVLFNLWDCELQIKNPSETGDILFDLLTSKDIISFKLVINTSGFKIEKISTLDVLIIKGTQEPKTLLSYFNGDYPPQIGFIENSILFGNRYIKYNEEILDFPKNDIIPFHWEGTDLTKESMGFDENNFVKDSIQYKLYESLQNENWDVIFNDDDRNEMADLVTLRDEVNKVCLNLYHIKFVSKGDKQSIAVPTNNLEKLNLYQICGQVQKSINWKYKDYKFFKEHFNRRENLKKLINKTRILKGDLDLIDEVCNSMRKKPLEIQIFLVQPGINKNDVSENVLKLLYVTANHLDITAGLKLKVIGSEI
ncbi:DEAD/DEAH box helicase [Flavobacterium johnsoniae]|uniref:Superfamily II DNA or RNA helicase n=1 Tax=Flavobacterium johnsoniae TaxID=986 RepID=A0A1M5QHW5_FLAJO|nr:DEAD/DEAH box helicase family protein [Flavobacterium johnsoniae]SHH13735.1 Superfamily II DNA or RNA helicase [Flavobacterium johnsoniae]